MEGGSEAAEMPMEEMAEMAESTKELGSKDWSTLSLDFFAVGSKECTAGKGWVAAGAQPEGAEEAGAKSEWKTEFVALSTGT